MSTEQKMLTDDDIRAVCNEMTPIEALVVVIGLFQRMTVALERIAEAGPDRLFDGK